MFTNAGRQAVGGYKGSGRRVHLPGVRYYIAPVQCPQAFTDGSSKGRTLGPDPRDVGSIPTPLTSWIGGLAERSNAAVLKTVLGHTNRGSNP